MPKECCILKLNTGEELIARAEFKEDEIVLDHPMLIQVIMQQNTPGFGMLPWVMSSQDTEFTIDSNIVIAKGKPKSDLESKYLSAATGLTL